MKPQDVDNENTIAGYSLHLQNLSNAFMIVLHWINNPVVIGNELTDHEGTTHSVISSYETITDGDGVLQKVRIDRIKAGDI